MNLQKLSFLALALLLLAGCVQNPAPSGNNSSGTLGNANATVNPSTNSTNTFNYSNTSNGSQGGNNPPPLPSDNSSNGANGTSSDLPPLPQ